MVDARVHDFADLLVELGLDDIHDAGMVASIAMTVFGAESDAAIQELSIAAVRHVVCEGLMQIGDTPGEGEFRPWEGSPLDCVRRYEAEWQARGRPSLGEIGWLLNTEKGVARGEEIQARENAALAAAAEPGDDSPAGCLLAVVVLVVWWSVIV